MESNKVKLPENIQNFLLRVNLLSAAKILSTSNATFRRLGAKDAQIQAIRAAYSRTAFPGFYSATECTNQFSTKWKQISFGCPALDQLTNNGIPTRGITEISGESGSGKTQIALQLSLMTQLPEYLGGIGKGVVYICTEDVFPSKRLGQMIGTVRDLYKKQVEDIAFSDNIFIEHIIEVVDLLKCVSVRMGTLMQHKPIGLIVIDSVGAIFRTETNAIERATEMRKLAYGLLKLSSQHGCALVCINQVSSVLDDSDGANKCIPCLGLAWANLVSTRMQIHRSQHDLVLPEPENDLNVTTVNVRKMEIVFSPDLECDSVPFLITSDGVCDTTMEQ